LRPRILTSETVNEFDPNGNHIGTNFKTGINMVGDKSVLIIVMPHYGDKQTSLGAFSDGVPSIIQSLARIRGEGNVHIFLRKPSVILDKANIRSAYPRQFERL